QLSLRELGERGVAAAAAAAAAERRIAREAPLALRSCPLLEHEAELVLPIHRDASGRIDLPRLAVHHDRPSHASVGAARDTSVQSSQASGAYVTRLCRCVSSLISSGSREAWARWDIS